MKKLLYVLVALLISFDVQAALLTGQTPGSYSLPSGWSLVRTTDFEGTKPSDEYWGRYQGTKTSAMAHGGTYSVGGQYNNGQDDIGWEIQAAPVGTFSEIYLSYYEYTESQALFNDEYIISEFGLDGANQRIFIDWFWAGDSAGNMGINGAYATLSFVNEQGPPDYTIYPKYAAVPKGAWVQWEIHLRPASAAGVSDGFIRVYKDGVMYASSENKSFNYRFGKSGNSTYVVAGGLYNRLVWMNDYPTCTSCTDLGVGTDACTSAMDWWYLPFSSPACPPATPNFNKYFDDIILMKLTGAGGGYDAQPPYTTSHAPPKGSTGVDNATTTHTFMLKDDRTDDEGTTQSTISMTGPDGTKTCTTGTPTLTCTGTPASYAITYPGMSLTNDEVANFTLTATDGAGNILNKSWSWTVESAAPSTLSITTTTLPDGTVGTPYSQTLAATGGAPPYSWSIGSTPYDPGYPYAPSTTISGVAWDYANVVTTGPGSDLWHTAWAGDNNVYMTWGDGGGPDGTNLMCRTRFGLVRANGTPPNFTWTEIWGCKADGTGCDDWGETTHSASCDAPYGGTLSSFGVPDVLFAIDNTLYVVTTAVTSALMKISYSTDLGQSWTSAGWTWDMVTGFNASGIASFGMGYAGARDTYVYMYGGKRGDKKNLYLARVPKTELMTQGSWEYFTGTAASPAWGTWANATSIHYDANRVGESGSLIYSHVAAKVQYFPAIAKYIMTVNGGQIQQLRIYDAPEPWGPWTTVYYNDLWGDYGATNGLYYNIIPKFTNGTDTEFWMTFSGYDTPVNYDNYHLIKGTFTLAGAPQAPPTGLALSSGGIISGTPTTVETKAFTPTVTDSGSPPATDNQALSITINAATPTGDNTVTITAITDTWTNSGEPDRNYNDNVSLQIYQWPFGVVANRSLLQIDHSSLPANISITSAALEVYLTGPTTDETDPMPVYTYRVTGTLPNISTVTWNTFAGTLGSPVSITDVSLVPGWKSFNVLEAMQASHAAGSSLTLALDGATASAQDTNRTFASMDHATEAWRPRLKVMYTQLSGPHPAPSIMSPGKLRIATGSKGRWRTFH